MSRSSRLKALKSKITAVKIPVAPSGRDPRTTAQIILGLLLVANIGMAIVAFRPWAETPAQLARSLVNLRKDSIQNKAKIEDLKVKVARAEKARQEGDQFIEKYFLGRRTAASTLATEVNTMAKASGIKPKEHSMAFEEVEGSDTIAMMTITANYEGTYADLIQYVNRIDRSTRLFIIESLAASPQQGGQGVLNINMKLNLFVRVDGIIPQEIAQSTPAGGQKQ